MSFCYLFSYKINRTALANVQFCRVLWEYFKSSVYFPLIISPDPWGYSPILAYSLRKVCFIYKLFPPLHNESSFGLAYCSGQMMWPNSVEIDEGVTLKATAGLQGTHGEGKMTSLQTFHPGAFYIIPIFKSLSISD